MGSRDSRIVFHAISPGTVALASVFAPWRAWDGRPTSPRCADSMRRLGSRGWAHLCDGDDALGKQYQDRDPISNGQGFVQRLGRRGCPRNPDGSDLARQRRPEGGWGPPAWAFDPGSDILLHRPVLTSVRGLHDGKIRIERAAMYSGAPGTESAFPDCLRRRGSRWHDHWDGYIRGTDPGRVDTEGYWTRMERIRPQGTPQGATTPAACRTRWSAISPYSQRAGR